MFNSFRVKNTMDFRKVLIFMAILVFSCGNKKKMDNLKFKEVLLKIHQCEAYNELKFGSNNATFLEECKNTALKETNVTKEMFQNSMVYYTQHPKELETLYDTLLLKYQ